MKINLLLFIYICSAVVAHCMGERLIGDWKSDKERTMSYLREQKKFSDAQLKKLESIVGTLTVSYDGKHMHAKVSKSESFHASYRVIGDSPKMIIIEITDPNTQKPTQDKLRFEGDSYWVTDDRIPGFSECFVRVPKK